MAIKQHFPTPSLMLITAKWPEISIQQGCGSVLKTKFSAYKARPGKVLSVFRVVFFEWTTVGSGLFIMNNFQNTLNLNFRLLKMPKKLSILFVVVIRIRSLIAQSFRLYL